ncbi:hypothetical protein T439DRAFT_94114 [Meredithblackwellia eburnea MCA 4105]
MTTVLLHPQTYRSPTLPSTSTPTPTPLPHRSRPTQQLTVHSTHPSTTSHHHPTKPVPSKTGLPLLSPSPPLPHLPPLSGTTTPIHLITGEQYVERVRQHQRVRLPLDPDSDSGVFPWLHHGSEVRDSLMSGYFGFGRGKAAEVPLLVFLSLLSLSLLRTGREGWCTDAPCWRGEELPLSISPSIFFIIIFHLPRTIPSPSLSPLPVPECLFVCS